MAPRKKEGGRGEMTTIYIKSVVKEEVQVLCVRQKKTMSDFFEGAAVEKLEKEKELGANDNGSGE